ncbi:MAG: hypothetical protein L3J71_10105 [Victivallaceae bacterium]|nr:hypothetical protein [Victivallaceae bacterium]
MYRSIAVKSELQLSVTFTKLPDLLKNLEQIGYVAIEIAPFQVADSTVVLRAYKGKHGPCYDTGRTAFYKGVACAALDDDQHILFSGGTPAKVCEKTAQVYQLLPYQNKIEVSDTVQHDPATMPKRFDCDTFENDVQQIKGALGKSVHGEHTLIFYPGPFKMLILKDGTLMRRGQLNAVPASLADELIKKESCFKLKSGSPLPPRLDFLKAYSAGGSAFLLGDFAIQLMIEETVVTDFMTLDNITPKLKNRLVSVIKENKDYFILIGSDPIVKLGCCPSEEVGCANLLVAGGVLGKQEQELPDDACPSTLYTFKGELGHDNQGVNCYIPDQAFRKEILGRIEHRSRHLSMFLVKWILLLFVLFSLLFSFIKLYRQEMPLGRTSIELNKLLKLEHANQFAVLLFHASIRCAQCRNMEKFSKLTLEEYFRENEKTNTPVFRLINRNAVEYKNLVEKWDIFTSTIALAEFRNGKLYRHEIVKEAWDTYNAKELFIEMLRQKLTSFMEGKNE